MRSLLRRRYQTHFEPPPDTEIVASCIGSLNEIYAICQSSSTSFQIFKQERESSSSILANFSASSPSKVVSAQYLAENDAIVLCLDAGEVVQVVLEPEAPNAGQAEVLGDIEERIAAAKWSPDEELLVLITGQSPFSLSSKLRLTSCA